MGFAVKNGIQGLSSKADLKNFTADITTALRSELAALTAYQLLLPTPHPRGSNSSTRPFDQLCHDFGPLDCRVPLPNNFRTANVPLIPLEIQVLCGIAWVLPGQPLPELEFLLQHHPTPIFFLSLPCF